MLPGLERLGVEVTLVAGRWRGHRRSERSRTSHSARYAVGFDHGGQQRGRHAPAGGRVGPDRTQPRSFVSHRRRAGRGQDSDRPRIAADRSAFAFRPQAARAEGHGGIVHSQGREIDAACGRRRPGKRTPLGHGKRGRHRRLRPRRRDCPGGNGRRGCSTGANSGVPDRLDPGDDRQRLFHRPPLSPFAGPRLPRLRGHGRRGHQALAEVGREGIAVSSGSACSANHAGQPSHVLQAIGFNPIKARGSLRITLGRFNTMEEAQRLLEILPGVVRSLRPMHGDA